MATVARLVSSSPPSRDLLAVLDRQLRRIRWDVQEHRLKALFRHRALRPDRLRALARWLLRHSTHADAVRLGIQLLGLVGTEDDGDLEVLTTLGTLDAFSRQAVPALERCSREAWRALFEVARRSEGWARATAVGRLEGATDPEIKEWLVRDSCTGDVLDGYLALTAARTGDLAGFLSREVLDASALDGASRLVEALTDLDGPGASLGSYPEAVTALEALLRHCRTGGVSLRRLSTLLSVDAFLDSCRPVDPWTDPRVPHVRAEVKALVTGPGARRLVLDGLGSDEERVFRRAAWAARRTGVRAHSALLARVERTPLDSGFWYLLVDGCPADDISGVVAAAERLLPLAELRTGPSTDVGLGREFGTDQVLDVIVSRLGAHPGHGWNLLATALRNRTTRNRRMALNALGEWPVHAVPAAAVALLETVAEEEPDAELRESTRAQLHRLAPDGHPPPEVEPHPVVPDEVLAAHRTAVVAGLELGEHFRVHGPVAGWDTEARAVGAELQRACEAAGNALDRAVRDTGPRESRAGRRALGRTLARAAEGVADAWRASRLDGSRGGTAG
ncbi:hypothetical protein [Streptomyces sp. NPDC047130]|uniref:hypothetical protein n=1 Tax=Streptomyces sp. NPDC047130 TaxID=3155261 RepID=UPI0033EF6C1B